MSEKGVTKVCAVALACIVLFQSPVFTVDGKGAVSSFDVSPIEVSAILAKSILPDDVQPLIKGVLMIGTAWKQVARAGMTCMMFGASSPKCSEAGTLNMENTFVGVTPAVEQSVVEAAGDNFALLAAACTVVTLGGLACFVRPIKMISGGLLLLIGVLVYTPNCKMLSPLVFMVILGVMILLGDGPDTRARRRKSSATKSNPPPKHQMETPKAMTAKQRKSNKKR